MKKEKLDTECYLAKKHPHIYCKLKVLYKQDAKILELERQISEGHVRERRDSSMIASVVKMKEKITELEEIINQLRDV